MSVVTIEGTVTPAAGVLKRGEQATVTLTPRVERLIKGGFVRIVGVRTNHNEGAPPAPAEPELPFDEPEEPVDYPGEPDEEAPYSSTDEPARNAKKEVWQEFLTEQNIEYPDDASRDDLIAGWVYISQQRAGGS
jgi:hypothetical protein